jgi:hypothetical protein
MWVEGEGESGSGDDRSSVGSRRGVRVLEGGSGVLGAASKRSDLPGEGA